VRGTYANTQRESPYERDIGYFLPLATTIRRPRRRRTSTITSTTVVAGQFSNVAFSDLSEDLYAGSIDAAYRLDFGVPVTLSAGYGYQLSERTSSRYQFHYFRPDGALPLEVAQERPTSAVGLQRQPVQHPVARRVGGGRLRGL
jgi:hypothetical protein